MKADTLISRLQKSEHEALVHWLHDDLGQNLIAIKSFSVAIMEQCQDKDDDTLELAGFIHDAAESSFRATYNLMQELRAEQLANQEINIALAQCLQESGLKEKGISHQLYVEEKLDNLDRDTKAFVLRSVRAYVNCCKSIESATEISVRLSRSTKAIEQLLELKLAYSGNGRFDESSLPELQRLRDRIEAIEGKCLVLQDNDKEHVLMLKFDPVYENQE